MFSGYGMECSAGRRNALLDDCPEDSESTLNRSAAQGRSCRPSDDPPATGLAAGEIEIDIQFLLNVLLSIT